MEQRQQKQPDANITRKELEKVSAGLSHVLGIQSDGSYGHSQNSLGQFGDEQTLQAIFR
jgi:hypothetical protein